MRKYKDNRYIYRIYQNTKGKGFLAPFYLGLGAIDYLVRHAGHRWDYLQHIKENDFIYKHDEPGIGKIFFFVPYLEEDAIQKLIVRNEDFYEREQLDYLKN